MAIRYHLRLMAVVVNNIRILLIGCAVFLCGLSYADVEEEDSGAGFRDSQISQRSGEALYFPQADARQSRFLVIITVHVVFSIQAGQINTQWEEPYSSV